MRLATLFSFVMLAFLSPMAGAHSASEMHVVEPSPLFTQIMSSKPDKLNSEAMEFQQICLNDDEMPLYYDCQCLAGDYAEKRKELGPDASRSAVQNRLGARCKDGTGIAEKLNRTCQENVATLPKGHDPEAFCECYSKKFTAFFENLDGRLAPSMKITFLSRARLTCQDPEAARKIYGIR